MDDNQGVPSLGSSRRNSANFLDSPSLSSKHLGLATVHEQELNETDSSLPGKLNFSKMGIANNISGSNSSENLSNPVQSSVETPRIVDGNTEYPEVTARNNESTSTIKLIPLRRSTSAKDVKGKFNADDDDDDDYMIKNLSLAEDLTQIKGKDDQLVGLTNHNSGSHLYRPSTGIGKKQNSVPKDLVDDDSSVVSVNSTNTHHNRTHLSIHKKDAAHPLVSASVNTSPRGTHSAVDNRRGSLSSGLKIGQKTDSKKDKYIPSTTTSHANDHTANTTPNRIRSANNTSTTANSNFSPSSGSRVRTLH